MSDIPPPARGFSGGAGAADCGRFRRREPDVIDMGAVSPGSGSHHSRLEGLLSVVG